MSNVVQLKRRNTGGALVVGTAPLTTGAGGLKSGEPVYDAVADILYIGKGDDGLGNSTSIAYVGGGGAFIRATLINAVNGIAGLDSGGKLPLSLIPASILGANIYQGTWNANTNTPALASGVGSKGFWYKVSQGGATALDGVSNWNIGDQVVFDGTAWDKIDGPAEAVLSVAGRIGAVTLAPADIVGLAAYVAGNSAVLSVAGKTGAVTLAPADIAGLAAFIVANSAVTTVAGRAGAVVLTAVDIGGLGNITIDGGVI
jgi:hypothetical protein